MNTEQFTKNLEALAMQWNGTPFCFKGYTRRGADCVGLIVGLLRKVDAKLPDDDGGIYEADWFQHDKTRNRYLEGWLKFGRILSGYDLDGTLVPWHEPERAGDVVCFWNTKMGKVVHSALYLGNSRLVHSHKRDRGVKILGLEEPWVKRLMKTWIRLYEVERLMNG